MHVDIFLIFFCDTIVEFGKQDQKLW